MMLHLTLLLLLLRGYDAANLTFTSNLTYWHSSSTFVPQFNRSYGHIQLHPAVRMELTFVYYGRSTNDSYENLFRVGYGGKKVNCNDRTGSGTRYPSAWILDDSESLFISISHGWNCFGSLYRACIYSFCFQSYF